VVNAQEGQVVVRTLYLSVDPYMRGRIANMRLKELLDITGQELEIIKI